MAAPGWNRTRGDIAEVALDKCYSGDRYACRQPRPIPDNSVALLLTDPPYTDEAELLWRWLGPWALRKLMPGGSLICYFGSVRVNRMYRILDDAGRAPAGTALPHFAPHNCIVEPRRGPARSPSRIAPGNHGADVA